MTSSIKEEIESFMNSKVCRDALRIKNDKEFCSYLASEIVSIIEKRIEKLDTSKDEFDPDYYYALNRVKGLLRE